VGERMRCNWARLTANKQLDTERSYEQAVDPAQAAVQAGEKNSRNGKRPPVILIDHANPCTK